jgi:hypothetical protein
MGVMIRLPAISFGQVVDQIAIVGIVFKFRCRFQQCLRLFSMVNVVQIIQVVAHSQVAVQHYIRTTKVVHQNLTSRPIRNTLELGQQTKGFTVRGFCHHFAGNFILLKVVYQRNDVTRLGNGVTCTDRGLATPGMTAGFFQKDAGVVVLSTRHRIAGEVLPELDTVGNRQKSE